MLSNRQFVIVGLGMALICLIPLALVHASWFAQAWPRTADVLCKGEDCSLLGWISGLSGWAAVVAAWVTLRALRAQIDEANRHQRENVELQIAKQFAIAKRAGELATSLSHAFYFFVSNWNKNGKASDPNSYWFSVVSEADYSVFDEFEKELGIIDHDFVKNIRESFPKCRSIIQNIYEVNEAAMSDFIAGMETTEHDNTLKELERELVSYSSSARYCAEHIKAQAEAFTAKWSSRIVG